MKFSESNHVFPQIRNYLNDFAIPEDELQQRMRAQAVADDLEHWIIPAEVGRLLFLLTKMTAAKSVYEIGSYLGYSATWFAKALSNDGIVVVTEQNPTRYAQAEEFLTSSDLAPKLDLRKCDALEDLGASDSQYDIIFIDHDKPMYSEAFLLAKEKVKPGGLIVADNVLWRKRIIDSEWQNDPSTQGVLAFNRLIMEDLDVVSLILAVGDGVSISYRI